MSYHDRQSLNQTIPRHISKQELSPSLRNRIQDEYDHIYNHNLHITEEERYRWNQSAKRVLKPATVYADGLMTKEDKAKLDSIEPKANKYVHPFSNVVPGSYLEVTTDGLGHVIYGNNPARLNIRARNATKLGNINPDEFVSPDNAFLKGNVSFRKYTNDLNHLNYPITKKDLVEGSLDSSYYISTDDTPNLNKIRINPNTGVASYYDADLSKWVDISLPSNVARLDSNGKVPLSIMPQSGIPIGAIMPAMFENEKFLTDNGFLLLNGGSFNKNDYPDLYNFAKKSNLLYKEAATVTNLTRGTNTENGDAYGCFYERPDGTIMLPNLCVSLASASKINETGFVKLCTTPRETSTFDPCTVNNAYMNIDGIGNDEIKRRLDYFSGAFRITNTPAPATGTWYRNHWTNEFLITTFNTNTLKLENINNDQRSYYANRPCSVYLSFMIKAKY